MVVWRRDVCQRCARHAPVGRVALWWGSSRGAVSGVFLLALGHQGIGRVSVWLTEHPWPWDMWSGMWPAVGVPGPPAMLRSSSGARELIMGVNPGVVLLHCPSPLDGGIAEWAGHSRHGGQSPVWFNAFLWGVGELVGRE